MEPIDKDDTTCIVETPLSLEVGRRYVDRLGCVIEITERWAGAVFQFTGRQVAPVFQAGPNEFRFRADGGFMPEGRSDYDLVAEAPGSAEEGGAP